MPIDKKTGLMVPPVYPCYKAEGLCDLRTVDTTHFECAQNPDHCRNRHVEKAEPETDETAKMWTNLGTKSSV